MIIRSHVGLSKPTTKTVGLENNKIDEEVIVKQPVNKTSGKKKKTTVRPIIEEEVRIVEEDKSENEDLESWLKEEIED